MEFMQWLKAVLTVAGTAMVPVLEVKAAIPLGTGLGLPLWESFASALIGSIIPVPFLLLFFRPILKYLKGTKLFSPFAHFMERHVTSKSQTVHKYSLLGLFILVAIPLPGTGVWTGSMVAALLDIRIKHAVPIIFVGNVVASICILAITGMFV